MVDGWGYNYGTYMEEQEVDAEVAEVKVSIEKPVWDAQAWRRKLYDEFIRELQDVGDELPF